MRDSRLQQALALLDDARSLLVDIVDEGPDAVDANRIDAARQFINSAVTYVQDCQGQQCAASPMGGGRCELEDGHAGQHFKAWKNRDGGFSWDDESQRKLADKHGSRFD